MEKVKQLLKQFLGSEIMIVLGLILYGLYGLFNWKYKFNYAINEEGLKVMLFQLSFFFIVISFYNIFYVPIFFLVRNFFTRRLTISLITLFSFFIIVFVFNERSIQYYDSYVYENQTQTFNFKFFIADNYFKILTFCFLCLNHFIMTLIFLKKRN